VRCGTVHDWLPTSINFFNNFFFAIYAIRKQEQRKLHTVKFNKRGTATINKGLMLDLSLKSMQPILHIFVL
jgi:hypothetical protein